MELQKIYLRIKESPPNSKVRIVCQCGKVVSSPSRTITIDHSIAKLTQDRNYEETVKVKFNKNTNEYLSKLVLKHFNRYQYYNRYNHNSNFVG